MPSSPAAPQPARSAPQRVRERFRDKAQQFDDLYEDERPLVRLLRPGLFRRRELAVRTVQEYGAPRVLDVGCGSGRIGEFVLTAGASRYVGIDFSEPMIELARERLERFSDRAELLLGDFLDTELDGPFDVVLALGLFDYLPEPQAFADQMGELCAPHGCVVGSFPAWSLLKGPVRKIRYEWLGDCPIFNYERGSWSHCSAAPASTGWRSWLRGAAGSWPGRTVKPNGRLGHHLLTGHGRRHARAGRGHVRLRPVGQSLGACG